VSVGEEQRERTSFVGQLVDEVWPLASPFGALPDPTPADGPDSYGNPDPDWLRIDWSEHLRTVELPSQGYPARPGHEDDPRPDEPPPTRVNYVELGGPARTAVVFIHGLAGCWQNWLENIPHFARSHRVLALDLPGFGHSPMPDWKISIESYGRLVRDFCDELGADDCAIVGNSMGGFVAAEAAIANPGRFEKLVLVSAVGVSHARLRREPAEALARFSVATAPLWLRIGERSLRRRRLRRQAFGNIFYDPSRLRSEFLYEVFHNGTGRPGFLPAVGELFGYDILERLEEVDVPTLIVWGRNDRVVPATDAFGYAERLPNSRVVIFDRCGHVPMAERPARFNRLLERFMAEAPAS
jgi:pimeloyl-ACP methyl ester carboxylesterase